MLKNRFSEQQRTIKVNDRIFSFDGLRVITHLKPKPQCEKFVHQKTLS